MKTILFSSVLVACASVLLISCKKDRVCECSYNGQTEKITLLDATKRQAKDYCVTQTMDIGNGQSVKYECKLK